ncbi:MAG TPA: zinc ribbon domain-containing protein [Candidatus Pacearchaeota archaeon]|nr:zinc ribbon domain-containing protein [Candidatus Pacearchaeota archaeon]
MFSKKNCKKCGEKLSKRYDFCPICGTPVNTNKRNEEDGFGLLGKNDFFENSDSLSTSLFGGLSGGIMNKMLNNAMKMLEKELQQNMRVQNSAKNNENIPRTKFRLMINGKEVNLNDGTLIKKNPPKKEPLKKDNFNEFTEEQNERFSKLKKIMPESHLKRIDDKIIYEIELPGVDSLKDTSIIQLEDGIEIRALSEKKAYLKRVPLNLSILNYYLSKNLLILEFKGN